ncbi:CG0192-related protein [Leucobacter sp. HY1908]
MALIYSTTLRPSKLELIASWLPGQDWFHGDVSLIEAVGAYRFDDPEGEVGIEGHLLRAGDDTVYHVPLTYRGAPLAGAEAALLGTVQHGVLGTRWFYDATADPVYAAVLTDTITGGGREAQEFVVDSPEAEASPRETVTKVWGSGSAGSTLGAALPNAGRLEVLRELGSATPESPYGWVLRGTWPGLKLPALFAVIHEG